MVAASRQGITAALEEIKVRLTVFACQVEVEAEVLGVMLALVVKAAMKIKTVVPGAQAQAEAAQGVIGIFPIGPEAVVVVLVSMAQDLLAQVELQDLAAEAGAHAALMAHLVLLLVVQVELTVVVEAVPGGTESVAAEEALLFVLYGLEVVAALQVSRQLTWGHK